MTQRPYTRPALFTAGLLAIPAVMTWSDRHRPAGDGWHWGPGDFAVMGLLLFGAGVLTELLLARTAVRRHRAAIVATIAAAVLVVWVELAVDGVSRVVQAVAAG